MSRLAPKVATIRKLFANSGNRCAFPGCTHLLIDEEDFVGQICHIEAANEGGERYKKDQSDEERRSYDNLIIFCHMHHVKTDNIQKYPVDVLKKMKLDHESQFHGSVAYNLPKATEDKILGNITEQLSEIQQEVKEHKGISQEILQLLKDQISVNISSDNNQFYSDYLRDIIELRKNGKQAAALEMLISFKKNNWKTIQDEELKYNIIMNLAGIYLDLHKQQEAAKCLLELEKIDFGGEENASYLCLAFTIIGDGEEFARVTREYYLADSTNITYWTSYILLNKRIFTAGQIDENLPDLIKEHPQVLINLAELYFKDGQLSLGFDYIDKAKLKLPIEIKDKWNLQNWLATTALSAVATKFKVQLNSFNSEERSRLSWICELYTEVWNYLLTTDFRGCYSEIAFNLGMVHKMLDHRTEALRYYDEAWRLDNRFVFFQGLVFHLSDLGEKGREDFMYTQGDAIRYNGQTERREFDIMLSQHIQNKGDLAGAIALLENWLDKTEGEDKLKILDLISLTYFQHEEYQLAQPFVVQMLEEFPTCTDAYLSMVAINRNSGDDQLIEGNLEKAFDNMKSSPAQRSNLWYVIGLEYLTLEKYREASECFLQIYNPGQLDEVGLKLFQAYFKEGDYDRALQLYDQLDDKGKTDPNVNEYIFRIFKNDGKLSEAKTLLNRNLEFQQGRAKEHFVRLGIEFYKFTGDQESLLKLLQKIEITERFNVGERFHIAELLLDLGDSEAGLSHAYEARLDFFETREGHSLYLNTLNIKANGAQANDILFPSFVSADCGVTLTSQTGAISTFFITDHKKVIGAHILRSMDSLTALLMGRQLNEDITLPNAIGKGAEQKITLIVNKYTYAYHESMGILETKYSGERNFSVIRNEGNDLASFRKYLELELAEINRSKEEILELYRSSPIPIGLLQMVMKVGYIDSWLTVVSNPTIPVYCLDANEWALFPVIFQGNPSVVIELSSLLTLTCIIEQDELIAGLSNCEIFVSGNTMLELREYGKMLNSDRDMITIGYENGRLTKHVDNKQQIQKFKSALERIICWCENNAKIQSPRIRNKQSEKQQELLGIVSSDSLLLAKELGAYLMSDDERLKSFALGEYAISAFGSYSLLAYLSHFGFVDLEAFTACTYKYIRHNYVYIPVDHTILWKCLAESSFKLEPPFTCSLNGLLCLKQDMLATVIVLFAKKLYSELVIIESIEMILHAVFNFISNREDITVIKSKIGENIPKEFELIPISEDQFARFLDDLL